MSETPNQMHSVETHKCRHNHGHHHHHHHHAAEGRVGLAFWLNLIFAIIELIGGILTNSMAILSDALHDFGDSLALGCAWWLEKKSQQPSNESFSYGYRRLSIFSAFLTGGLLAGGALYILVNSIKRISEPQVVHAEGVLILAFFGVIVNGVAFYRLSFGSSLNEKMLSWHFIEDLIGWVIVLLGAIAMLFWDIPWLDPLLACGLSIWVIWNVLKHLRSTIDIFLQVTPISLRGGEVRLALLQIEGVHEVHHMHIWSLDGESHILTAHVVVSQSLNWDQMDNIKKSMKKILHHKFQIQEATVELEKEGDECSDPIHRG